MSTLQTLCTKSFIRWMLKDGKKHWILDTHTHDQGHDQGHDRGHDQDHDQAQAPIQPAPSTDYFYQFLYPFFNSYKHIDNINKHIANIDNVNFSTSNTSLKLGVEICSLFLKTVAAKKSDIKTAQYATIRKLLQQFQQPTNDKDKPKNKSEEKDKPNERDREKERKEKEKKEKEQKRKKAEEEKQQQMLKMRQEYEQERDEIIIATKPNLNLDNVRQEILSLLMLKYEKSLQEDGYLFFHRQLYLQPVSFDVLVRILLKIGQPFFSSESRSTRGTRDTRDARSSTSESVNIDDITQNYLVIIYYAFKQELMSTSVLFALICFLITNATEVQTVGKKSKESRESKESSKESKKQGQPKSQVTQETTIQKGTTLKQVDYPVTKQKLYEHIWHCAQQASTFYKQKGQLSCEDLPTSIRLHVELFETPVTPTPDDTSDILGVPRTTSIMSTPRTRTHRTLYTPWLNNWHAYLSLLHYTEYLIPSIVPLASAQIYQVDDKFDQGIFTIETCDNWEARHVNEASKRKRQIVSTRRKNHGNI